MDPSPPTTDKPLDPADGPGKADAEMGDDAEETRAKQPAPPVDADDALIQEPRDNAFKER